MARQSQIPSRFEALDALRGICAMLVVLFHIPIYHALKDFSGFANLQACVDVFFVLSGFVLSHAYGGNLVHEQDIRRFVWRRFVRLWPLHAFMLAVFILFEGAKYAYGQVNPAFGMDAMPFSTGHSFYEVLTNILFLQSFDLHPDMSWNGPAWSVAVEFYLSILFAIVLAFWPGRSRTIFLGLGLFAGLLLYIASPDKLFVSTDFGVLRAALGFFFGCLIYDLRVHTPERLTMAGSLETATLVVLIGLGLTVQPGPTQYLFPIACALLVYVFSFGQGPVSQLLHMPIFQRLGLWSYSIYMIHTLVFQVLKTVATFAENKTGLDLVGWHKAEKLVLIGTPSQALVPALVLCVLLVLPFAALTYRLIEKPAMDRLNDLLGRAPARGTNRSAQAEIVARARVRARAAVG